MQNFKQLLAASRVLPVVTAYNVDSTVRLARALVAGGMSAIEITLRTDAALEAMQAVREQVPGMTVAAGTVIDAATLERAVAAGAEFCVSPGISREMMEAAKERGVPLLPGVATASEVLLGIAGGLDTFKLFPAVAVGGEALLKGLHGPFPDIRFCPTGGLNPENFRRFLALPNVICCGGSWMVAETLVTGGQWDDIETLAREAMRVTGD